MGPPSLLYKQVGSIGWETGNLIECSHIIIIAFGELPDRVSVLLSRKKQFA